MAVMMKGILILVCLAVVVVGAYAQSKYDVNLKQP